ncbi:hypothetical protein BN946_scf184915.g45 [Trametes cinnabarina]|uniref:SH3 domain-containing protein n=1 Tax=Pycnoporus cinnabarinus TaxID=5643 RepID=A0A060SBT2_PYCCI|nr:hypothetical protein BN946_scf184915.g45 [Trametes cinnabarina]
MPQPVSHLRIDTSVVLAHPSSRPPSRNGPRTPSTSTSTASSSYAPRSPSAASASSYMSTTSRAPSSASTHLSAASAYPSHPPSSASVSAASRSAAGSSWTAIDSGSEDDGGPDGVQEEYVLAMHDFAPQQQSVTCLSFRAGQVIHVLNRDPSGWWDGEVDGRRGWFPSNYVTSEVGLLTEEELPGGKVSNVLLGVCFPTLRRYGQVRFLRSAVMEARDR